MSGWLDALLGRIRSAGVDLVLGNGLNFLSPITASRNDSTGFIDVTAPAYPTVPAASTSVVEAGGQYQRAALTGEATASQNANAVTVTRSTDYDANPWTGAHKFEGRLSLGTAQEETGSGAINVTLGDVIRLRFSHATGAHTVGTISGCAEGRILIVEFNGTGVHTVTHSTATDAVSCPGDVDLVITGRGGFVAVGRLATFNNWKIIATTN